MQILLAEANYFKELVGQLKKNKKLQKLQCTIWGVKTIFSMP